MNCSAFGDGLIGPRIGVHIGQTLETPECTMPGWDAVICWYCSSMAFRRFGGDKVSNLWTF